MSKKNTPTVTPITTEGAQVMKKRSTPTEEPSEILKVSEASPIEATTQPSSETASSQASVLEIQAVDVPDTTEAEITGEMEASLDDVKPVSRGGECPSEPYTTDSLDIPMVEISEVATCEPVSYDEVVIPPEKARVLGPHFNSERIARHKMLAQQETACFLEQGQLHYEDWVILKAHNPREKKENVTKFWTFFVEDVLGIELRTAQMQRDIFMMYCLDNPSNPDDKPFEREYLLRVGITRLHLARILHNAVQKEVSLMRGDEGITDFCLDRSRSKILVKFSFDFAEGLKAGEWIDFANPKLKVRTLREWMPQAEPSQKDSGDDSLEEKSKELRRENKKLKTTIKELTASNESLRRELAETQAGYQSLEEQKDLWQSKYEDLLEKYTWLSKIDEQEQMVAHESVTIV